MSSAPTPPPPADPVATANAQTGMNKATAVTQFGLNATNQTTPDGSLSYKQIGTWEDGTPRFQADQTLSPEQQKIHDVETANSLKLGTVGGAQIDRIGNLLSQPVDLSKAPAAPTFNGDTSAIEGRIGDLAHARLDPILAQKRAATENQLANQGVAAGSEAWQHRMDQLGRDENDANNQLLLGGRQEAFNELGSTYGYGMDAHKQGVADILAGRNQPINEITALTSGSQVTMPQFAATPQTSVAPVDFGSMVANQDNINQRNFAANMTSHNAMMGGLFGLAGAGAKMAMPFLPFGGAGGGVGG